MRSQVTSAEDQGLRIAGRVPYPTTRLPAYPTHSVPGPQHSRSSLPFRQASDHLILILGDEGSQRFGAMGGELAARAVAGADAQAEREADRALLHPPPAVQVVDDRQGAGLDADQADRRAAIPGQRLLVGDR